MTKDNIIEAVLEAVCKQFNLREQFELQEHPDDEKFNIESVRSLKFIEDFKADCLDIVELVMEIEWTLQVEIDDYMLEKFFGTREDISDGILYEHTVQELIDYLITFFTNTKTLNV